ncbi:MAG: SDR family NAD(P)-dependent oxidoreductase, partial [Ignavibacteria bacterium]|nr:SDR family NAD(P)-dependent oxidoreductase [Ignavibacteria bacterium]
MKDFEGKIVFITGASSGIGESCAREFAKLKANLIVAARRVDRLKKLADELEKKFQVKVKCLALD